MEKKEKLTDMSSNEDELVEGYLSLWDKWVPGTCFLTDNILHELMGLCDQVTNGEISARTKEHIYTCLCSGKLEQATGPCMKKKKIVFSHLAVLLTGLFVCLFVCFFSFQIKRFWFMAAHRKTRTR